MVFHSWRVNFFHHGQQPDHQFRQVQHLSVACVWSLGHRPGETLILAKQVTETQAYFGMPNMMSTVLVSKKCSADSIYRCYQQEGEFILVILVGRKLKVFFVRSLNVPSRYQNDKLELGVSSILSFAQTASATTATYLTLPRHSFSDLTSIIFCDTHL